MARILVVDDEVLVQMALAELLEDAGHSVLVGRADERLRDDLEAGAYDVVLTDLNMPVMNGWDVATWVKQNRPQVPVIAISGRWTGDLDEAWARPFTAVLSKPVEEPKLLKLLEGLAAG